MRNVFSYKHERYCVCKLIFNTNTIHNYMQLKVRDFFTQCRSSPNEMMCSIRTLNVVVVGVTGLIFMDARRLGRYVNSPYTDATVFSSGGGHHSSPSPDGYIVRGVIFHYACLGLL